DRPRHAKDPARPGARAAGTGGGVRGAGRVHVRVRRRVRDDPPAGRPAARPAGGRVRARRGQAPAPAVVLLPPADGPPAAARAADRARAGPARAQRETAAGRRDQHLGGRAVPGGGDGGTRRVPRPALQRRHDAVRRSAPPRGGRAAGAGPLLRAPGRADARRGGVHRLLRQLPPLRPRRHAPARRPPGARRRGLVRVQPPVHRVAADGGAPPRPALVAGSGRIDRAVLQLLPARPRRDRLGRRDGRRRPAVLRRDALRDGARERPVGRARGVRPHSGRHGRALLPRHRRPSVSVAAGHGRAARAARDPRRLRPPERRAEQHHQVLRRLAPGPYLPGRQRPLPPRRLAAHDRRKAEDARRPVPTPPHRADQPLDADPGGVHRADVPDRADQAVLVPRV
ncbi:MAG: hypothetical protein AVDCRST_MAG64-2921, partial [uncultured Phycisphaerae bacterium]